MAGISDLPLIERRQLLERLLTRGKVPGLHLLGAFDDGQKLLEAVEQHGLEGVVSKRGDAPYHSGECRDWAKTTVCREANANDGGYSKVRQAPTWGSSSGPKTPMGVDTAQGSLSPNPCAGLIWQLCDAPHHRSRCAICCK